ncbi:MAG: MATE family efflux transporter [Oscillospiraceae bacterium]|nr:MATE family efflux transporter [Oscillospiraceae bacterium]
MTRTNDNGRDGAESEAIANPLGTEKISKLLPRFALPSVIAMLTGALYNIADQVFIGRKVGYLGMGATNVDMPIAMIALAAGLLFGVGGAANFSLSLGAGDQKKAARYMGGSVLWMAVFGIGIMLGVQLFLEPLVITLGASGEVLPYSLVYSGIVAWGLPAAVMSFGMNHLIRADGSPGFAMFSTIAGCCLNISLDAVLMYGFDMGVAGAAWATTISQYLTLFLGLYYMIRKGRVRLTPEIMRPYAGITLRILSIGAAAFFNQLTFSAVQVALNKTLTHYGAQSQYGADIPLAAVGAVLKVNMLFMSVVIGVSQGCQPIIGFNYGARRYGRVRKAYMLAAVISMSVSTLAFICYQLFPGVLAGIFNSDDAMFQAFAVRSFRVLLMLSFLSGIQPVTSNFFASIGKAFISVFISLTRQFIFFLPLLFIFPRVWGIDGVLYASPAADLAAFIAAVVLVVRELRKIKSLEGLRV